MYIGLSTDNVAEGMVSPSSLTFTTSDWNVPQTVTVTGVDDLVIDGNISYNIIIVVTSPDITYDGVNAPSIVVTNTDNDAAISGIVDFNANPIQSYGGQYKGSVVTVKDGGTTLRIVGNSWKKVDFPYTVTVDTILEFDFQSTVEGEIHGIGFDTNDNIGDPVNLLFKLHGTQNFGAVDFDNYAGETPKHYIIPVGQYYTGDMLYLFSVNDHDVANPTAESVFKNVKVYEQD